MRNWREVMGLTLLSLAIVRCGGNDICLNCDAVPTPTPGPRQRIAIEGSINSWTGFSAIEDIVVIACFDLDPSLTSPTAFNDCVEKTFTRPNADRNFNLTNDLSVINQNQASIRIAFWVNPEANPASEISDGDSFAELTQAASAVAELEDVSLGRTVQINPVDVVFAVVPDSGVGTTARIQVLITPEATPTPAPEPTP